MGYRGARRGGLGLALFSGASLLAMKMVEKSASKAVYAESASIKADSGQQKDLTNAGVERFVGAVFIAFTGIFLYAILKGCS